MDFKKIETEKFVVHQVIKYFFKHFKTIFCKYIHRNFATLMYIGIERNGIAERIYEYKYQGGETRRE